MYLSLKNRCLLPIAAVFAWTALGWTTEPVLGQEQPPVSTVFTSELREYGWEPPERQHEPNMLSIAVDHQSRVLLGFTVLERQGLVTRDQPSLSFHIVRLGHDGKVDLSLSLPTHTTALNSIYLSDTDQILARANDGLQFLLSDEGNQQKPVWKTLASCAMRCRIIQSNSRHTLILYDDNADQPLRIIYLSQEPVLKQCGKVASEDKSQNYPRSITDEFAYFNVWEASGGVYREPLCDHGHRSQLAPQIRGSWAALNDNTFVVYTSSRRTGDRELEVVSADGQVKFRPTMVKHESAGTPIRSSEQGNRIAVNVLMIRGRNTALDISGHVAAGRIAIYDIESGKQAASIALNRMHRDGFEFAISPDGHYIAVREDDALRLIELGNTAVTSEQSSVQINVGTDGTLR